MRSVRCCMRAGRCNVLHWLNPRVTCSEQICASSKPVLGYAGPSRQGKRPRRRPRPASSRLRLQVRAWAVTTFTLNSQDITITEVRAGMLMKKHARKHALRSPVPGKKFKDERACMRLPAMCSMC